MGLIVVNIIEKNKVLEVDLNLNSKCNTHAIWIGDLVKGKAGKCLF